MAAIFRVRLAAVGTYGRTVHGSAVVLLSVLVALWRVILEAVNHVVPRFMPVEMRYPTYLAEIQPAVVLTKYGLGHWASWDGFHYYGIVAKGYEYGRTEFGMPLETAFFPAFSYLVKILSLDSTVNPIVVGLALNVVLTALTCAGIYYLANAMIERYAPKLIPQARTVGLWAAVLFLVTPSSFYMAAFYADALLVCSGTWALYFAVRGQYLPAALLAAVASGCKSSGLIIAVSVVLIYMEQRNYRFSNLRQWFRPQKLARLAGLGLLSSGGLVAYMTFLWLQYGDPLLFMKAQELWHRHNSLLFIKKLYEHYYQHIFNPLYYGGTYGYVYMLMVMALPFIVIGLAVWFCRKYRTYWPLILTLLMLILALASGIMQSLNRYCLILTPLYVAAAMFLVSKKLNPYVVGALLLLSFQLLLFFTGGFLQGGHFSG